MRKDRIEARLRALGINQFDAAVKAGRNSHFIYDFLIGRKKSFKGDGPIRLAQALECSIEYLTGESDEPGRPPLAGPTFERSGSSEGLPLAGVVESGVFRRPGSLRIPDEVLPLPPFPGYPAEAQVAYVMRGNGLDELGVTEGMVLTAVQAEALSTPPGNGAIVVIELVRNGGSHMEISAREVQHSPRMTRYIARSRTEDIPPIIVKDGKPIEPGARFQCVALVISATMLL